MNRNDARCVRVGFRTMTDRGRIRVLCLVGITRQRFVPNVERWKPLRISNVTMGDVNDFSLLFYQHPDEDRWRPLAACKDMDSSMFFANRGGYMRGDIDRAKAVCATCPVIKECGDYALEWDERRLPGVWGGMTGQERRRERQRRGITRGYEDERVRETA